MNMIGRKREIARARSARRARSSSLRRDFDLHFNVTISVLSHRSSQQKAPMILGISPGEVGYLIYSHWPACRFAGLQDAWGRSMRFFLHFTCIWVSVMDRTFEGL